MCTYRRLVRPSGDRKSEYSGRRRISMWQRSKSGFVRLETDRHRETGGSSLRRVGEWSNTPWVVRSFPFRSGGSVEPTRVGAECLTAMAGFGSYPAPGTIGSHDEEEPSGRKVSGLFLLVSASHRAPTDTPLGSASIEPPHSALRPIVRGDTVTRTTSSRYREETHAQGTHPASDHL